MSATRTCPACGAAVTEDVLGGRCPRCIAKIALGTKVRYFGDYELLEEIGRGGMGVVFKARQASLNRLVAVKMLLHGDFASEEFVKRFQAEAEAAASLQHPNIVAIHEIGFHDGQHYFSMDYVEGRSLAEVAREKSLSERQAARCLQTMAEAIHYAHRRGILHRDLKPSNVLMDERAQPRITDFGLAKRLYEPEASKRDSQLTLSGQVLGAPSYIPPEQAAGNRGEVGVASDVYGLGAILYHLLTGRPPFLADTLPQTLLQVQAHDPMRPRDLNPALSADLETICLKCLRKDPRDRYSSAAALAEDLRRWLAGEPILARPLGLVECAWRVSRRHPALATVASLVVFGLLAAGLFWPRPPPLRIPPHVTELIVLVDNTESPRRLCLTDPNGSFWHLLPTKSGDVDVAPDGRRLCYLEREGPNSASLWVSRLDGTGRRRILAPAMAPLWLDDHTVLYQPLDHLSLWTVDIDTKQARKLFDWNTITPRGHAGEPQLSPDGRRLLCNPQNGARAHTADVFICDLEGKNVRTIWEDVENPEDQESGTADHHLLWLDDNRVVWCRHARPGNRVPDAAIVTCRIGDTNLQALTGWKGYNYPLAASPNRQRLLYVTEDTPGLGQAELWTMNLDGTGKTNLPGLLKGRKFSADFGMRARWVKRSP